MSTNQPPKRRDPQRQPIVGDLGRRPNTPKPDLPAGAPRTKPDAFRTCPRCMGFGGMDGGCPKCGGTGYVS